MRYYASPGSHGTRLLAEDGSRAYDLTAANDDLRGFADLATAAAITDLSVDEIAERHIERADPVSVDDIDGSVPPVRPVEVWAAGVTYKISEEARQTESGMPEMYIDAYENERPELFFKATADRIVGHGGAIGIREDSGWDVPEPELGIVLHRGDIVGYTVGNDVSSRSIEGANPLYLPQAKIYDKSCALGPCVVSAESVDDPHDLEMSMKIRRDDATVFDGSTSTSGMVRTCEELTSYYTRHNAVPAVSVLMTGTSLVPDDEFTLRAGDEVSITIENIGTLTNTVEVV